jgi:maltokinase
MTRAETLGTDELFPLIVHKRWFASKGREPESARVSGVTHVEGDLELALVEVRFPEGTHETYLLPLAFGADGPVDALDLGERPDQGEHLCRLARLCGVDTPCEAVRPIGVEQSNSSVVLDERYVLKVYRRLEAGPSPELELLRALGEAGFEHAPRLSGFLEHAGDPLETVLAIVTELIPGAGGGWELTLDALASGDAAWLPRRARRLGEITGAMHAAFAMSDDPHLVREEASAEAIALLAATIDEDVTRLAAEMPELVETTIGRRVDAVRDLVRDLSHVGPPGSVIRTHGDYHLGQVLWTAQDDWVVIDFEGEPNRSLAERRRRTFALRDVAGMLRSFAYAAEGVRLLHGMEAPEGWEWSCRAAFLDGWRSSVDPRLLPESEAGIERLLELFEVQKLLYELRYELGNRPQWVSIPAGGLMRLLERL